MIVYLITNQINDKKYIGQSIHDDPEYFGSGILINKAINKYGRDNFKKVILCRCEDESELNKKEIYFISKLHTLRPDGYNLDPGGQPNHGPRHPEVILKMSDSLKGRKVWNENLTMDDPRVAKNIKASTETIREQFRNGRRPWNKDLTKDTDDRIRKAEEKRIKSRDYDDPHFRNAISKAQKGRKRIVTDETKQKLSIANKGQVSWRIGLTKETDDRVLAGARKMEKNWGNPEFRAMMLEARKK